MPGIRWEPSLIINSKALLYWREVVYFNDLPESNDPAGKPQIVKRFCLTLKIPKEQMSAAKWETIGEFVFFSRSSHFVAIAPCISISRKVFVI